MEKDNTKFQDQLGRLREGIDLIDADILTLLSRRQAQVEKVVALKKAHAVPVYHPAREEDLISKLRIQAKNARLDPDFMEDLYRVILRQSRVKQTQVLEHKGVKPQGKVLVVGGAGQMGSFFSNLFIKSGYQVEILTEEGWDQAPFLCKDLDLALISVPIEKTIQVIQDIAPFLPPQALVADLTSVKTEPMAHMLKHHPGPVLGIHPLFGPGLNSLDKQIIVVTPGRDAGACQWLKEQLSLWGAVIVESTPEEHDEIMEIVQALRHFATFCFGEFLSQRHIHLERTLEFSSPIYRLELGMVGRLFAQDSALYAEIIFATPQRRALLQEFIASLGRHLQMLENNDKQLFMEQFNQVARWFGPFSDQAMRESSFLINKLIERF